MNHPSLSRRVGARCAVGLIAMIGVSAVLIGATAQTSNTSPPYEGQRGKDVIWLPTQDALVSQMLDMAKVTPADFVVDLGSGDGRTVIAAAKRGARAMGVEYDQSLFELAVQNAVKAGVSDRTTFKRADLFETDFSEATVVTLFLLRELNLKLRPRILEMKPGTRVVSNTFEMGDWIPDQAIEAPAADCRSFCRAHFWVVPAKAAGTWRSGDAVLTLEQKYQMISGTMKSGNFSAPIIGRVRGEETSFTAGDSTFIGRLGSNSIEGTSGASTRTAWRAVRD